MGRDRPFSAVRMRRVSRPDRGTTARRLLVVGIAGVELLLAGLVVLGMASGTHQQSDKGDAPLFAVVLVQGVGVVALALLGTGVRSCVLTWRGRPSRALRWFLVAGAVWLVWAFCRVGEYAS